MMNKSFSTVVLLASLVSASPMAGAATQEITWDDLVPAEAQFDDPFTLLDDDQLYELSLVAQIRDRLEAGEQPDSQTMARYEEWSKSLREQEIDIDGLISMRDKVAEERVAKTYIPNRQLDGKPVKIPGYLLPLEFEGKLVREFLLVPYVGACIHTPPPPPNQIVHVTSEQGFTTDGGLYTPVWVSGTMQTRQGKVDLDYVDGSSQIPTAYRIDASSVTVYE